MNVYSLLWKLLPAHCHNTTTGHGDFASSTERRKNKRQQTIEQAATSNFAAPKLTWTGSHRLHHHVGFWLRFLWFRLHLALRMCVAGFFSALWQPDNSQNTGSSEALWQVGLLRSTSDCLAFV